MEKLQLQGTIEVEGAHRAGKPVSGSVRPRPIIVKFVKYKDRSMILQRAKYLKGSKIYINEDYTDAVHQERKDLMPKLKAARDTTSWLYIPAAAP